MKIQNHRKAVDKILEGTEKRIGERGELDKIKKEAAVMNKAEKWLLVALIHLKIIMVFKEIKIDIINIIEKIDGDQDQEIEIIDRDLKVMINRSPEIRKIIIWIKKNNFI